jgi:lipopolysaccharide transport system permease protein
MAAAAAAPFSLIWRHRRLLAGTTMSEVRGTYAGSILGLSWVVVGPLLLLAIYGAVYAVIFKVRPADLSTQEYVLLVFAGLVPFLTFSTALGAGSLSISRNRELVFNTVFPVELIAVRDILVASASLPAGMVIVTIGDAIVGSLNIELLLVPLVIVLQTMFVIGVCWIVAYVALVITDIEQILVYLTILLLVVTPIAYTPAMVPENLKFLMLANPLYYFVTSYQYLVVLNSLPPLEVVIGALVIPLVVFLGGYHVSSRMKMGLLDFA